MGMDHSATWREQLSCRMSQTARLLGRAFSTTDKAWNVRMNATSRVPYCPPRARQYGIQLEFGTPFPLGNVYSLHTPPRDWLFSTRGTAQSHRPAESILMLERAQEVEWGNEETQDEQGNKTVVFHCSISHLL